jgi:acyl-CoA thioester hydrolase
MIDSAPVSDLIRVRYGETDQMGHAYYGNYFLWFEQARGAWCRSRGFNYSDMEALGYKLPCVEAHAEYKREILYDDVIDVRVSVTETRRASIKFTYEIYNTRTGDLTTTGYTWHVVIGPERKAVTIPAVIREWLQRTPESPST